MWVVVKIRAPCWVLNIIRHLILTTTHVKTPLALNLVVLSASCLAMFQVFACSYEDGGRRHICPDPRDELVHQWGKYMQNTSLSWL